MKGKIVDTLRKDLEETIEKNIKWQEKKKETGKTDIELHEETGELLITDKMVNRAQDILNVLPNKVSE